MTITPIKPKKKKPNPSQIYRQALSDTVKALGAMSMHEANAAATRASIETSIVESAAPAHFAALYRFAPELATARDTLVSRMGGQGPSRLEQRLEQQAYDDLGLRGELSAQDERLAQQGARRAFASRGMSYGTPSAVAEVLSRQQYSAAREGERRQFAGSVEAMRQNRHGNEQAFASSAYNQLWATLDPYKRVFAAPSMAGSMPATLPAAYQMAGNVAGYDMDYRRLDLDRQKHNQEMQMAQMVMEANRKAGIFGGALGAFGQIAGGLLGGF